MNNLALSALLILLYSSLAAESGPDPVLRMSFRSSAVVNVLHALQRQSGIAVYLNSAYPSDLQVDVEIDGVSLEDGLHKIATTLEAAFNRSYNDLTAMEPSKVFWQMTKVDGRTVLLFSIAHGKKLD